MKVLALTTFAFSPFPCPFASIFAFAFTFAVFTEGNKLTTSYTSAIPTKVTLAFANVALVAGQILRAFGTRAQALGMAISPAIMAV